MPDDFVGEVDFKAHLQTFFRGFKRHFLVPVGHGHFFQNANGFQRRALFLDARALEQENERRRRPVHNGRFRRVDFDNHVVDAFGVNSRHQMFNGGHAHAVLVADAGAKPRVDDVIVMRGDDCAFCGFIDAVEHDAGVDGRGFEAHGHFLSGVQSDADAGYFVFQSFLLFHI